MDAYEYIEGLKENAGSFLSMAWGKTNAAQIIAKELVNSGISNDSVSALEKNLYSEQWDTDADSSLIEDIAQYLWDNQCFDIDDKYGVQDGLGLGCHRF